MKKFIRILLIMLCFNFLSGCESTDASNNFLITDTSEGRKLLQVTEAGALKPKLVIPSGVQIIGSNAFERSKTSLVEITIPASVDIIETNAFLDCVNLEKVNIIGKTGFKKIDGYAFAGCPKLKTITLNGEIEEFVSTAFFDCENLVFHTDNLNNLIEFKNLICAYCIIVPKDVYEAFNELELQYHNKVYCKDDIVGDFVINDDMLTGYVGKNTKVDIPNNIKGIVEDAFSYNKFIREVNIPDSVTQIGQNAFYSCKKLEKVIFGTQSKIKVIERTTFKSCDELRSINLPDTVEEINYGAFQFCELLVLNTLPANLITIDDFVFSDCPVLGLKSLPNNLKHIGKSAFASSKFEVEELVIPSKVIEIKEYAFAGTKIKTFTLSSDIRNVGQDVFPSSCKLIITGSSLNYKNWKLTLNNYNVTFSDQ